ncbi:MAG: hypothetical protein K2Q18_12815, partial [Bdellovibrionales bacterium]|nr:hypothetical protein [Bdellovibrionales bacterium]
MTKMSQNKLYLNFYGAGAVIESDNPKILKLIENDFYFFKCEAHGVDAKSAFQLKIVSSNPPENLIPEIQTSSQSLNSLTYEVGENRYNDYYGELTSKINFLKNEAVLFSENLNKTHEISYLIILSRVGKKLDLMGLHKLHAFAVAFDDIAVVCMMPMKGGKSTLLMELLKHPKAKMISDDIPLIDRMGNLKPFPIKIGLDKFQNEIKVENPDENIYHMHRSLYGTKTLISVRGLKDKIVKPHQKFKKVILIEAFRVNSAHSYLGVPTWPRTLKGLFKHGIIGFGLPMVMEYFWENGLYDFGVKTFIFFSRLFSFLIFSLRTTRLRLHLGNKPEKASKEI